MEPAELAELQWLVRRLLPRWLAEAAGCSGKARFESYEHAMKGLRPRMGNAAMAYRCRYCSRWHIGHRKPRLLCLGRKELEA